MYKFVRGTTFQFAGVVQNDGVVQDLTNATIQASIYDQTGTILIATLTCTVLTPASLGAISLTYNGSTSHWPPGKAQLLFLLNLPNNPNPLPSDPCYLRIEQNPMIG